MSLRPEWVAVEENLRRWYEWAQREQPDDAIITHLGSPAVRWVEGQTEHCGGNLSLHAMPGGWNGSPVGEGAQGGYGVLVMELSINDDQYRAGMSSDDIPPFTEAECDALAAAAEAAGWEVIDRWNGAPFRTFSLGVRGIGPTLQRAAQRYREGCPVHGSVFCGGWQSNGDDEKACRYFPDGYQALVPVDLVVVEREGPPTVGLPADDDTNLEAVREALARLAPRLADLGVPLQVMAAGRRGRIDGTPGDLEFVDAQGHGVLFPAEVAEELVRLALVGIEIDGTP